MTGDGEMNMIYQYINLDDIHIEVEETLTDLMLKFICEYHDVDLVVQEMHYAINRWERANLGRGY